MDVKEETKLVAGGLSGVKIWRAVKFESLSFIAILFALFFTKGYVYLETLNARLGVPVNRLGFDGQLYAVYGGVNFLVIFTAFLIVIAGALVFSSLMAFFENPNRQKQSSEKKVDGWFLKRVRNAREFIIVALVMVFLSLCFYWLWAIVVSNSVESAEKAAYREVRGCELATISLKNMDVIKACVVGESDDMLYLIYKGSEGDKEINFDKGMLSKSNVRSVRSSSSIKLGD